MVLYAIIVHSFIIQHSRGDPFFVLMIKCRKLKYSSLIYINGSMEIRERNEYEKRISNIVHRIITNDVIC